MLHYIPFMTLQRARYTILYEGIIHGATKQTNMFSPLARDAYNGHGLHWRIWMNAARAEFEGRISAALHNATLSQSALYYLGNFQVSFLLQC